MKNVNSSMAEWHDVLVFLILLETVEEGIGGAQVLGDACIVKCGTSADKQGDDGTWRVSVSDVRR